MTTFNLNNNTKQRFVLNYLVFNGPLQLSDHVVQNHQTGEQLNGVLGYVKQRKFKIGGFV